MIQKKGPTLLLLATAELFRMAVWFSPSALIPWLVEGLVPALLLRFLTDVFLASVFTFSERLPSRSSGRQLAQIKVDSREPLLGHNPWGALGRFGKGEPVGHPHPRTVNHRTQMLPERLPQLLHSP